MRRKEHQRFAREIAERLEAGLAAGEFSALWLFASSPFLGELKAQLSDAVDKRVQLALDSDLTSFGLAEIEQRLRDVRLGKTWGASRTDMCALDEPQGESAFGS